MPGFASLATLDQQLGLGAQAALHQLGGVVAFLLAGFTLLSAFIFHNNFGNQVESIMFLKNVAIAGGFLLLVANGAGPLSVDYRVGRRR